MEKSQKTKIWMYSSIGVIMILAVIWGYFDYPRKLEEFNRSEIKGRITQIYSSSGRIRINLNNQTETHLIFTEYNDTIKTFFDRFASTGDSIYKAPDDKFVHVFKENKEFLFNTIIE
jgi:hypothetical protein